MDLHVHEFDRTFAGAWEGYIQRHPAATLFHGLAWKRAVERTFGHYPRYFVAEKGGEIVGVLPLFEVNSLLTGRFLVSMPYATYGGILADHKDVAEALLSRATAAAQRAKAQSIELRSIDAAVDAAPIQSSHVMFRKALPADEKALWQSFPRKARAAARQATQRYDLEVVFDPNQLPIVWELYSRSMRRLGSPNYPYRFFEHLAVSLGGDYVVQLVRHRGRPVAGLLTFLFKDTVMPYFAGLDERAGLYGLNNYLYLESMRWGIEHGYGEYDFGRTRIDNTGSYNFKRFCGFEPRPLKFQTVVMSGQAAPDLAPSSPRWAMARRVWKTLPLPVTRPLGGWLAKSIPG